MAAFLCDEDRRASSVTGDSMTTIDHSLLAGTARIDVEPSMVTVPGLLGDVKVYCWRV